MYIEDKQLFLDPAFQAPVTPPLDRGRLPVVDIQALRGSNHHARNRAIDEIGAAASDTGFIYIRGHGVPDRIIQQAYLAARRFFELPLSEKNRYYIGRSSNHRGYVPFTEQGDYADEGPRRYEAFDLAVDLPDNDPDYLAGNPLLGPNVWPQLDGFRHSISTYYDQLRALGDLMCGAFEAFLGLDKNTLSQLMTKPTSQLRLLHYIYNQCMQSQAHGVNMGAHTDYEFFTILHQSRTGLWVMDREDNWISAPPVEGTFVMHIGDMLEVISNGLFRATPHKVVNNGFERFSMPFFVAGNFDAVIEPSEMLKKSDSPVKYRPYVAGHHLLAQLLRDFPYLKRRHARGNIPVTFAAERGNTFENRLEPGYMH